MMHLDNEKPPLLGKPYQQKPSRWNLGDIDVFVDVLFKFLPSCSLDIVLSRQVSHRQKRIWSQILNHFPVGSKLSQFGNAFENRRLRQGVIYGLGQIWLL